MSDHQPLSTDISDAFRGFSSEALRCIAALQQFQIVTPSQLQKLTYGCTCGQCIDDFLSPRMKFALLCQAEITDDLLEEQIDNGPSWYQKHNSIFRHVVPDIKQHFRTNQFLRQGFTNTFAHAVTALKTNLSPTSANVLQMSRGCQEWPPVTQTFFDWGGTVESALKIAFERARGEDELAGNRNHKHVFRGDIERLPECRNDHEFGFVALACGLEDVFEKPVFGHRLFF